MSVHALIVAAGRGSRFGASIPKQYLKINHRTILEHTLYALSKVNFDSTTLVVAKDDVHIHDISFHPDIRLIDGGQERFDSVKAGVQAIKAFARPNDLIAIHDVARACVLPDDIHKVIAAAKNQEVGAILGVPVADTLKSVAHDKIAHTVSRDNLWHAQTPQVFRLDKLLILIDFFENSKNSLTDEASGFEQMGLPVAMVQGSSSNIKLTHPSDLPLIQAILTAYRME